MKNFALQNNIKIVTILVFTFMTLLMSNNAFSQDFKVLSPENNFAKKSSTSKTAVPSELNTLVSQLLPTVYYSKGTVSSYGETSAVRLETDIQGINSISEISSKLGNVKIAKIFLNNQSDLNSKINVDSLESFQSLKYVYVIAKFETSEAQISNMIINTNPDILILFSTSGK